MTIVPSNESLYVKMLIEKLKPSGQLTYVDVIPAKHAIENFCFQNVDEQIANYGGEMLLGWQIWQFENFMIEAEAHAVWKSPQDSLVDVTQKDTPCDKILFVSDNIHYNGQHIDNIRLNISGNKLIDDFILLAELRFAILNAGERASEDNVSIDIEEFELLKYISNFGQSIIAMARDNMNHNSQCFCGDGRKYKHCHGDKLEKQIKKRIKLLKKYK